MRRALRLARNRGESGAAPASCRCLHTFAVAPAVHDARYRESRPVGVQEAMNGLMTLDAVCVRMPPSYPLVRTFSSTRQGCALSTGHMDRVMLYAGTIDRRSMRFPPLTPSHAHRTHALSLARGRAVRCAVQSPPVRHVGEVTGDYSLRNVLASPY